LDGGDGAGGIALYMIAVLVSLGRTVEGAYARLLDSFGPLSMCKLSSNGRIDPLMIATGKIMVDSEHPCMSCLCTSRSRSYPSIDS
jgi:hypothetical protein